MDVSELFSKIQKGDRVALGKAVTLVESDLDSDRKSAIQLLDLCFRENQVQSKGISLTISGSPGAGKSTLIEKLGLKAISQNKKVAVITIDPTSAISEGSILGDKSRMPRLSQSEDAFIRSSPAGSLLGGIGRRTPELIFLFLSAGYDLVLTETVGVGQSEHASWQLTDGFILVVQPGSGDELQGIKRGITELADIIVINKADGPFLESAAITRSHYQNANQYISSLRNDWKTRIVTCSATEGTGIDELWEIIRLYWDSRIENNQLTQGRDRQNTFWLSWSLGVTAHRLLMNHPSVNQKIAEGLLDIRERRASRFRTEYEIEKLMKDLIP